MNQKRIKKPSRKDITKCLEEQEIVGCDKTLALAIAKIGKWIEFSKGDTIIKQGSRDSGVYFIVSGSTDVYVNEKHINFRSAGQHVGEMATIEKLVSRSATVKAREPTSTIFVSAEQFINLCDKFPIMWRKVAATLNRRLRDRARHIRVPNPISRVFIGSSTEAREAAYLLAESIRGKDKDYDVEVWADEDKIFKLSKATYNSLVDASEKFDFAVFILSPDDRVFSRKKMKSAPRDNLIYELGLFTGALGCERTYFISPANIDLKLPSDLAGITNLRCKFLKRSRLSDRAISNLGSRIRAQIKNFGSRTG